MALTANQFAQQIIAQLRILDPSASAEVGTPERKLIDSVAQSLAANQVDLTGLGSGLNINAKAGSNLDQFAAMFGMQRQQSTAASGFVVFSRNTPAPQDITVASGQAIQSTQSNANYPTTVQFATQAAGTIPQGGTQSAPVPVQAAFSGSAGNTDANSLTQVVGGIPNGVTTVTNPQGITNGLDPEDDNSFKTRFQNTWARNLAGTSSQYLALALAGAFSTKANVIGNQSTYQEYIQVPNYDDAGYLNGTTVAGGTTYGIPGRWTSALSDIAYAKQIYTTTPAFISDSNSYFYREGVDYVFNNDPSLNGPTGNGQLFGDTARTAFVVTDGAGHEPSEGIIVFDDSNGNIDQFTTGAILVSAGGVGTVFTYTGISESEFTGCQILGQYQSGVWTTDVTPTVVPANVTIYPVPNNSTLPGWTPSDTIAPNWTFLLVYPNSTEPPAGLQALTPGEVVLSQYNYISTASRNDLERNINNAVDIYVNGANDVSASTIFLPITLAFSIQPSSAFYIENFRRDGEPSTRPSANNYFTPLYQSPIDSLPPTITVNNQIYYLGYHYFLVHELSPLQGSIRARDGIEWNFSLPGDSGGGPDTTNIADPAPYVPDPPSITVWASLTESVYGSIVQPTSTNGYWYQVTTAGTTGATEPTWPTSIGSEITDGDVTWTTIQSGVGDTIVELVATNTPIEVDNYTYDSNIVTMQGQINQSKQITTDPLVHKALTRYFKFMVTIMYSLQQTQAVVNNAIQGAVSAYLNSQYYGAIIQLSSILDTISSVNGVQNVRWTNDIPGTAPTQVRVIETDVNGNELAGANVQRQQYGTSTSAETQLLTVSGEPNGRAFGPLGPSADFFTLTWNDPSFDSPVTTSPIAFADLYAAVADHTAPAFLEGYIESSGILSEASPYNSITVAQQNWHNSDGTIQFILTYADGNPYLPTITQQVSSSSYTYDSDFFMLDDQLPALPINAAAGDAAAGFVIQVRAQNAWNSNLA
jgi:uncharacterized phage protein gp47/JayE